jgi:uncharacterized protein YecE (DUF72 family)
MASRDKIHVGTSGWTYAAWRGPFFPRDVPQREWLSFYASRFATTEVNGSFYRTPDLKTVRAWARAVPGKFVFAWKASKYITHWKRLGPRSPSSLRLMRTRLKALGSKAGPALFQLPPNMQADHERLAAFLKMLPPGGLPVFEFRHPSWYREETYALLRKHRAALCLSDHADAPAPWIVTAKHVYVRGHGPGGHYKDHYAPQTLGKWARTIRRWRRERRSVYVYFDNDQKSAAPADAQRLINILEKK